MHRKSNSRICDQWVPVARADQEVLVVPQEEALAVLQVAPGTAIHLPLNGDLITVLKKHTYQAASASWSHMVSGR
jgi:hypothetical protein